MTLLKERNLTFALIVCSSHVSLLSWFIVSTLGIRGGTETYNPRILTGSSIVLAITENTDLIIKLAKIYLSFGLPSCYQQQRHFIVYWFYFQSKKLLTLNAKQSKTLKSERLRMFGLKAKPTTKQTRFRLILQ